MLLSNIEIILLASLKIMYYIGYDIGSSSVKIALVDTESKNRISIISEPSEQMDIISMKPNWAEQDPEKANPFEYAKIGYNYLTSTIKKVGYDL